MNLTGLIKGEVLFPVEVSASRSRVKNCSTSYRLPCVLSMIVYPRKIGECVPEI